MKSTDIRYMSPKAQDNIRLRVMRALSYGMSQTKAARIFGVSRQSVNRYDKIRRTQGLQAYRSRRRGIKARLNLRPYQSATIVRMITDRCPDQLKMPFMLWTRKAVMQLIQKRFGIKLSVWTVGRYLNRWGFTPQKPIRRAYEQNSQAVRRWLKKEYPAIRALAVKEKATIFWGDEMGIRSDHQSGTSFSRRGDTPVILGTGKRFRCNMISAIANRGNMAFMVFKNTFTIPIFLDFIRRLLKQHSRKIFLITDRHPVHISPIVLKKLNKNSQLRLYFLPGYSPELNPDELLNQDVKANAVGRMRPKTQQQLIGNIRRFLWSTQRRKKKVKQYFQGQHVRYAA